MSQVPTERKPALTPNMQSGKCRCCMTTGVFKKMDSTYNLAGVTQSYTDMLRDTFAITLAPVGDAQLICMLCEVRLRHALTFKRQIEESEETLLKELKVSKETETMPVGDCKEMERSSSPVEDHNFRNNTEQVVISDSKSKEIETFWLTEEHNYYRKDVISHPKWKQIDPSDSPEEDNSGDVVICKSKQIEPSHSAVKQNSENVVISKSKQIKPSWTSEEHNFENLVIFKSKQIEPSRSAVEHNSENVVISKSKQIKPSLTPEEHNFENLVIFKSKQIEPSHSAVEHNSEIVVFSKSKQIKPSWTPEEHNFDNLVIFKSKQIEPLHSAVEHNSENFVISKSKQIKPSRTPEEHNFDNLVIFKSKQIEPSRSAVEHNSENVVISKSKQIKPSRTPEEHNFDNLVIFKSKQIEPSRSAVEHNSENVLISKSKQIEPSWLPKNFENVVISKSKQIEPSLSPENNFGKNLSSQSKHKQIMPPVEDYYQNNPTRGISLLKSKQNIAPKIHIKDTNAAFNRNLYTIKEQIICMYCSKLFTNEHLETHQRKCELRKDDLLIPNCIYCRKVFDGDKTDISKHMWHVHRFKTEDNLKARIQFPCDICKQVLRSVQSKATHITRVHHSCNVCSKTFRNIYERDEHARSHRYKCVVCKESFQRVLARESHTLREHGIKCSHCKLHFPKHLLKKHQVEVHGHSKWNCGMCKNSFYDLAILEKHHRTVHMQQMNFECKICDYKCFTEDVLNKHLDKHDEKRSLICPYCGKSFAGARALECHERTHMSD